jgi:hypothetical protein
MGFFYGIILILEIFFSFLCAMIMNTIIINIETIEALSVPKSNPPLSTCLVKKSPKVSFAL